MATKTKTKSNSQPQKSQPFVMPSINIQQPAPSQSQNNQELYNLLYKFMDNSKKEPVKLYEETIREAPTREPSLLSSVSSSIKHDDAKPSSITSSIKHDDVKPSSISSLPSYHSSISSSIKHDDVKPSSLPIVEEEKKTSVSLLPSPKKKISPTTIIDAKPLPSPNRYSHINFESSDDKYSKKNHELSDEVNYLSPESSNLWEEINFRNNNSDLIDNVENQNKAEKEVQTIYETNEQEAQTEKNNQQQEAQTDLTGDIPNPLNDDEMFDAIISNKPLQKRVHNHHRNEETKKLNDLKEEYVRIGGTPERFGQGKAKYAKAINYRKELFENKDIGDAKKEEIVKFYNENYTVKIKNKHKHNIAKIREAFNNEF